MRRRLPRQFNRGRRRRRGVDAQGASDGGGDVREFGNDGSGGGGARHEFERRLCDDAQAAPGTAHESGEVVASHVLHHAPTDLHHLTAHQRDLGADHEVPRRAEAMATGTAVIRGEDAANGAVRTRGRIEGEPLVGSGERLVDGVQGHPRRHGGHQVASDVRETHLQTAGAELRGPLAPVAGHRARPASHWVQTIATRGCVV